jgi:lipid II:glycine glycyltransferase (peptidoglycan interpeptide bridge formation enzyme)
LVAAYAGYQVGGIEVRGPLDPIPGVESFSPAVAHHLPLDPSAEAVYARFSDMHRRNVRKAESAGLAVDFDQSLEGMRAFYRLHVLTRRRQGVPVQPWRFFRLLWGRLIAADLGYVALAREGRDCVAAAVFLDWNGTLVYKYGASDPARLGARPNHLLFWTAIRRACEQGCRAFDWGRTDLDNLGLRDFKRGWGAEETALTYSTIGSPATPSGRGVIGATMGAVIRHTPAWVGRVLGELLYRYAAG